MRVCLVAPSVRPGGGLSAVVQILNALGSTPDTHVTVFVDAADTRAALDPLVREHPDIAVRTLVPGVPAAVRHVIAKLLAPIRTSSFDVVLSINYWVPGVPRLVVYHLNLLNFQTLERDTLAWKMRRLDARTACARADRNLFESEFVFDAARRRVGRVNGGGLLYLGIRTEFASRIGESRAPAPGRIGLVTSTPAYKRNDLAIETLARLTRHRPEVPWHLRIVGGRADAPGWRTVAELADASGVRDRVQFLGRLTAEELASELGTCRALLAPSEIESFFMVAVEAMACGCQVVVQDVTSARESVGDAALVCRPGDVDELASALAKTEALDAESAARIEAGYAWARGFTPDRFRVDLLGRLAG